MTIATALLVTALGVGTDQGNTQTAAPTPPPTTETQQATPAPVAGEASPQPAAASATALDGRHRIELRFGGWANGSYDDADDWQTSGSAQGAFGLEYLSFVRNDLGVGIAVTGLVRAQGDWDDWGDSGSAKSVTGIPVVVRWYPIRRMTRTRSVEPYLAAGIGPVFGVDTVFVDDHGTYGGYGRSDRHDGDLSSSRVATAVGGRVGGGVDFRLGSVFTLGVSGAWNWDAGFPDDLWRGAGPGGGEYTVVLGWNFGR